MKTVQNLIDEERERQNPKFTESSVEGGGQQEWFYKVSNVKVNGLWVEVDGLKLA